MYVNYPFFVLAGSHWNIRPLIPVPLLEYSTGAGRRNLELLLRFDMEPAVHQLKKKFSELFELGHRLHPN